MTVQYTGNAYAYAFRHNGDGFCGAICETADTSPGFYASAFDFDAQATSAFGSDIVALWLIPTWANFEAVS